MSRIPDVARSAEMYAIYKQGKSLEEVGAVFGVTRQCVYDRLRRRGEHLRHRKAPNPFVEFGGERYARVISGHYEGYFRKTTGDREMLHRAVWRKSNGDIPEGHEVIYMDGDRKNNAPENLACLPRDEGTTMIQARLNPVTLKRCIACGEVMGIRYGWEHREGPAAYAKRKTCNPRCSADWKRGKKRGSRMPS